jgi:hypothetical protein
VQRLHLAIIKRSVDKLALMGSAERRPWTQRAADWQCTMTKVGKSDNEVTFAGAHGNDEVAP